MTVEAIAERAQVAHKSNSRWLEPVQVKVLLTVNSA